MAEAKRREIRPIRDAIGVFDQHECSAPKCHRKPLYWVFFPRKLDGEITVVGQIRCRRHAEMFARRFDLEMPEEDLT